MILGDAGNAGARHAPAAGGSGGGGVTWTRTKSTDAILIRVVYSVGDKFNDLHKRVVDLLGVARQRGLLGVARQWRGRRGGRQRGVSSGADKVFDKMLKKVKKRSKMIHGLQ
ncbi:hypothetical protein ACP4OV_026945 [Aristida adscensionis]